MACVDGKEHPGMNITGNVVFTGVGLGEVFGSCYGNHFGWTQANAVQNTWYKISNAAIATGHLNNVTHDGNGKLTFLKPGTFEITYSLTWENNTVNDHIDTGFIINSGANAEAPGRAHEETKFANVDHAVGSVGTVTVSANDTVELAIRTSDNNTPTLTVDSLNLYVKQVSG